MIRRLRKEAPYLFVERARADGPQRATSLAWFTFAPFVPSAAEARVLSAWEACLGCARHERVEGLQSPRRQAKCLPSGRLRARVPVARNSALASAGAIVGTPVSPTPPGGASDGSTIVTTSGMSAIVSIR